MAKSPLNQGPRYRHDCSECLYLGQDGRCDLYLCTSERPTVISRYGSGDRYDSGMAFIGRNRHLGEAWSRVLHLNNQIAGAIQLVNNGRGR